jgi:hypothetical protein
VCQIIHGINRSSLFSQILNQHTFHLTFSSKRQNNLWRKQDLLKLLGENSQIKRLSFNGFSELSMETVYQVLSLLPRLEYVEFKYCNIIDKSTAHYSCHEPTVDTALVTSPATHLVMEWTEFSIKSVNRFTCFPNITHIKLGANRNANNGANEMLMKNLFEYCPSIHNMTVSLPLIRDATLADLISHYGSQLKRLSLNCEGPKMMNAISTNAHGVTHLALRGTQPLLTYGDGTELKTLISRLKTLEQLDLISFVIQDIPMVIWKHLLIYDPSIAEEAIYKIKNTVVMTRETRVPFAGIEESLSPHPRDQKYDRVFIRLNTLDLKSMQDPQ